MEVNALLSGAFKERMYFIQKLMSTLGERACLL